MTLYSINAAGELTTVSRADASAQFPLTSVGGMTSATVGGQAFLFVSAPSDNAITALRVGASGTLTPVGFVEDATTLGLVAGMDVIEIGGVQVLVAIAILGGTLSAWSIGEDGSLAERTALDDTAETAFGLTSLVELATIGGKPFVVTGSGGEDGVTVLEIGGDADSLTGDNRANTILGLGGADTLEGGRGADTLIGGNGGDSIDAGHGHDSVVGGQGADRVLGFDGDDLLTGGRGNDTLFGMEGNDTLFGGSGNDSLSGGAGRDTILGAAGWDQLNGGDAADRLAGGKGNDTIRTGGGADVVVIQQGDGSDTVLDFMNGADRLNLTDFNFANFRAVSAAAS